jgi:hypothetical protein
MSDDDIIRIARKIDKLNYSISCLLDEIEDADHPNRGRIVKYIQEEIGLAAPSFVALEIRDLLIDPEKYKINKWGTGVVKTR